jgi:hypothetical protein
VIAWFLQFFPSRLAISRSSPKCVNQVERGHQASLNLLVQTHRIRKIVTGVEDGSLSEQCDDMQVE